VSETANLRALEIGSFEGLSANFFFWKFPNSELTCVDTWAGSTEHSPGQSVETDFTSVESIFLKNTVTFGKNVRIFKGKSTAYFAECKVEEVFDFIYVDGSHHSDDVMIDALNSFNHLRTGGVLIFDDYLWNELESQNDNPGIAINSFLRLKKPNVRLLHVGYQLILRKT
jgi:predicted O-methyltransferase YrrM